MSRPREFEGVAAGRTLREVAASLGVSMQQIDTWRKRYETFPQPNKVDGRNVYDLPAVAAWKQALEASRKSGSRPSLTLIDMLELLRDNFADPSFPLMAALACSVRGARLRWNSGQNVVEIDANDRILADALLPSSQWSKAQFAAVERLIQSLETFEHAPIPVLLRQFGETRGRPREAESSTAPALIDVLVSVVRAVSGRAPRVFDPACGSAGSLAYVAEACGAEAVGQDVNADSLAIAKLRAALMGLASEFRLGDSFHDDKFGGELFEVVTAVPPFGARIERANELQWVAAAPSARADLGWLQHVIAHTSPGGRGFTVMLAGALFDANRRSVAIRNTLVRAGAIQAVIQLPSLPLSTRLGHCIVVTRSMSDPVDKELLFIDLTQFDVGRRAERLASLCQEVAGILTAHREGTLESSGDTWSVVEVLDLLDKDVNLVPEQIVAKRRIATVQTEASVHEQTQRLLLLTSTLSRFMAAEPPLRVKLERVPLGQLIEQGRAKLIPGMRASRDLEDEAAPVNTVTVAGLRSGRPIGELASMSKKDALQAPLTQPGDIVFTTVGEPAARVDETGGNAVMAPVSILRLDPTISPFFVASAISSELAAKLMPQSVLGRVQIEAVPVPLVLREAKAHAALSDLTSLHELLVMAGDDLNEIFKTLGNALISAKEVTL